MMGTRVFSPAERDDHYELSLLDNPPLGHTLPRTHAPSNKERIFLRWIMPHYGAHEHHHQGDHEHGGEHYPLNAQVSGADFH
jgi:hypothetical protein